MIAYITILKTILRIYAYTPHIHMCACVYRRFIFRCNHARYACHTL